LVSAGAVAAVAGLVVELSGAEAALRAALTAEALAWAEILTESLAEPGTLEVGAVHAAHPSHAAHARHSPSHAAHGSHESH
jgi:hypothetical protein